jgi:putative flippase GtrA
MFTFFKANIASLIASLFDWLVTISMVTFFHMDEVIGSIVGTICGGILNFIIGRTWVFQSRTDKVHDQAFRYFIVWVGNLILNASGMYLLTRIFNIHYLISKVIVSLAVGFGYNYVLQKKFVFKKAVDAS